MKKKILAIFLLAASCIFDDAYAEKLSSSQKSSYLTNLKYQDILNSPQNFVDKKVALKVFFTETRKNNIKTYKDLLPETFDIFAFDGISDELPVVFSTKDENIKNMLNSIAPNTLVVIYCDISYKANKDKEKKNTNIDKRYYLKIEDIEANPGVAEAAAQIQSEDDFIFLKPVRLDIQFMDMLEKKIKLYLHFSEIGQKINPTISKFSSKNQNDFFCLIPKEKLFLPLIVNRRDEKIVSVLESLNPGELMIVYAIVQKSENPAVKNEEASYYLNVTKIEAEKE